MTLLLINFSVNRIMSFFTTYHAHWSQSTNRSWRIRCRCMCSREEFSKQYLYVFASKYDTIYRIFNRIFDQLSLYRWKQRCRLSRKIHIAFFWVSTMRPWICAHISAVAYHRRWWMCFSKDLKIVPIFSIRVHFR